MQEWLTAQGSYRNRPKGWNPTLFRAFCPVLATPPGHAGRFHCLLHGADAAGPMMRLCGEEQSATNGNIQMVVPAAILMKRPEAPSCPVVADSPSSPNMAPRACLVPFEPGDTSRPESPQEACSRLSARNTAGIANFFQRHPFCHPTTLPTAPVGEVRAHWVSCEVRRITLHQDLAGWTRGGVRGLLRFSFPQNPRVWVRPYE